MKKNILTGILIYSIILLVRVLVNGSIDHYSNYSHELIKIKNGEFGEPNNKGESLFVKSKYSDEQKGKFGNYRDINNNSRMPIGQLRNYKEKGNSCYLDKYEQEINVSGTYYLKTINGVIYIC